MRIAKGGSNPVRRVSVRRSILSALLLLGCLQGASAEDLLPIYHEWGPPLHDYHNEDGMDISFNCDIANASGGCAVIGLSYPGEWIEVAFTLSAAGRYYLESSFKSYSEVPNWLTMSVRPVVEGDAQSIDISFYGAGTG